MTGEYAWRRKGTGVLPGDASLIIEPGRTTVASLLKRAGYATCAVGRLDMVTAENWHDPAKIGRYVDRFTRRDGAWKIARRVVVFEVYRAQAAPAGGGLLKNWAIARRDGTDTLQQARKELGLPG